MTREVDDGVEGDGVWMMMVCPPASKMTSAVLVPLVLSQDVSP